MNHFIKILFLSFVISTSLRVKCQTRKIVNYNTEEGLPSPETYFVHQDKKGYYWFGTDKGLTKYDGYKFRTYTTENSKLGDNTVFKCFEDKNMDLWFVGYNGSISQYDVTTQNFEPFKLNDSLISWFKYWPSNLRFIEDKIYIFGTSDYYKYAVYEPKSSNIKLEYYNDLEFKKFSVGHLGTGLDSIHSSTWGKTQFVWANCYKCLDRDKEKGKWPISINVCIGDSSFFALESRLYLKTSNGITLVRKFDGGINHLFFDTEQRLYVLLYVFSES